MTTHSGDTSPGGSNSMSNSSARTSEESQAAPHKSFHLDCYNSSPEQDDESEDQCDEEALSQLMMLQTDMPRTSIGIQTDHNEDFPPLKFLQAIGEDPSGFMNSQSFYFNNSGGGGRSEVPPQQNPSQLSVPILSATSLTNTTTATAVNANTAAAAADASSSSSDGTLQLVIQNFRHMSDTVRGPCKYIQGVPWRIMVMPRQHVVQKKGTQKCLGFFLQCCPDAYSESWSCQASAELRLISQKPGIPNFIRKTNHVYTAKENDWGYSCFMTWADILDESQGYIKDDKVTLEVQVKAEPPKNILTHVEFKKKIQEYKRLADLQCQRGLIDKAIECNTQALKFCKDKDPQCKAELEVQKAHLIEMKLKQSIQRIEKGSDGTKPEDDSTTNLNALRQALGTNTRCNAAKASTTTTTKNKSTSTKDATATAVPPANQNNNITAAEKQQQQQQRAGTPPYTTQKLADSPKQNDRIGDKQGQHTQTKQTQKTSKSVEPQGQQSYITKGSSTGKEEQTTRQSKKRLYKSASTTEICAAGTKCKGFLNNKALVALGHFNKALLNSDEFDYMKDRYQEEEELLPGQIQHFLRHLSEGDKSASRLKGQIEKLESIASLIDKPDPIIEGLMKLNPEEADKTFVKAFTFCALEHDNEHNRLCETCLKEGHFQIVKRETSEFGCQTEFASSRRVLREDDPTLNMTQQFQQFQMLGQQASEDYINALKSQAQAYAAAQQQQQQQNQPSFNPAPLPALPVRRKKAAAKKNIQQQLQQQQRLQQMEQQQEQYLLQQRQQFIQAAINQQIQTDNGQTTGLETTGLDLSNPQMNIFAAATKPLIGTQGIDMNLSALTNLDLSKIHFPTDPSMIDPNQPDAANIFSRQYIEEWLRYSARNLVEFDIAQRQRISNEAPTAAPSGGTCSMENVSTGVESSECYESPPDRTRAQGMLVLLHKSNANKLRKKYEEFVQILESHANFRDLRNCIDRLLTLISVDDENFTSAESTVSVVNAGVFMKESDKQRIFGNFCNMTAGDEPDYLYGCHEMKRTLIESDPHDYMLMKELNEQEDELADRLGSILYQLHQASINDIVDRIEARLKLLNEKLKLSKAECAALKANDKKAGEQLGMVQKEFQNLNGKYEKLIQQLKDRKNEIKKLEKKAKSEAQLAAENLELQEKFDAMKKELGQVQRQLADEQAKYKRDTQSLADSKKHLNMELNTKYSELQKMTSQLDEKTQAVKKLESQLANERKNNSQTVSNLTERVKRAEVNFLEHKLEDGLRVLERAKDDCSAQIKSLETEKQKRTLPTELEIIKKNITEWENKREEVGSLITQAKTDFHGHIQAVKAGKQLSQLPKITVPKPPPCPKLHPMPPPVQHITNQNSAMQQPIPPSPLPLERKVITPPSRTTRTGAVTPQQSQPPFPTGQVPASPAAVPPMQFQPPGMGAPLSMPPSSANVTPVKGHFQPQAMTSQPPPIGHMPPQQPPIAPIGVRPSNYQNGQQPQPGQRQSPQLGGHQTIGQFQAMPPQQFHFVPPPVGQPQHIQQQAQQQQIKQPSTPAVGGASSYQTWNGAWTAGDQLNMNNIGDIFGQGRSFGPLGSDFGGSSGQSVIGSGGGGYRSSSVTNQPSTAGVIGAPPVSAAASSQPIGAGRNVQNVSPSQSQQQQQQRNGWSTFADTWNPPLSGRQN